MGLDRTPKELDVTGSQEDNDLIIKFPLGSEADNASLTLALADIVNAAYAEVEHDMFLPSYQRTSSAEVAQFIRNGQLAVAYHGSTGEAVGCIFIKLLSPNRGEFGMMALDTKLKGNGLGRQLAVFAEDECRRRGCTTMQLELLVPTSFQHFNKERMHAWYLRLGYRVTKLGSFDEKYPDLAKMLAGPADYKIFEKSLV
ncbi:Fc.00g010810.m01.CDS01 [Cosmosporella sp. VM-42]